MTEVLKKKIGQKMLKNFLTSDIGLNPLSASSVAHLYLDVAHGVAHLGLVVASQLLPRNHPLHCKPRLTLTRAADGRLTNKSHLSLSTTTTIR